jgi:hypothetical protein
MEAFLVHFQLAELPVDLPFQMTPDRLRNTSSHQTDKDLGRKYNVVLTIRREFFYMFMGVLGRVTLSINYWLGMVGY